MRELVWSLDCTEEVHWCHEQKEPSEHQMKEKSKSGQAEARLQETSGSLVIYDWPDSTIPTTTDCHWHENKLCRLSQLNQEERPVYESCLHKPGCAVHLYAGQLLVLELESRRASGHLLINVSTGKQQSWQSAPSADEEEEKEEGRVQQGDDHEV